MAGNMGEVSGRKETCLPHRPPLPLSSQTGRSRRRTLCFYVERINQLSPLLIVKGVGGAPTFWEEEEESNDIHIYLLAYMAVASPHALLLRYPCHVSVVCWRM